jgi:hypothetical protein
LFVQVAVIAEPLALAAVVEGLRSVEKSYLTRICAWLEIVVIDKQTRARSSFCMHRGYSFENKITTSFSGLISLKKSLFSSQLLGSLEGCDTKFG